MSKGSVLCISKRPDAASSRYRLFQYWDYLREQGWNLEYLPADSGRLTLLQRAAAADIVVIQRKLFDPLTLGLLRRANPRLVFDYDDAIFLRDDGVRSRRRERRFQRTTRAARLCLAGNHYLASHAASDRTHLLPTAVDLSRYPFREPPGGDGPLQLVWIGSRSTAKYLEAFRETFEYLGRHAALELKVIADFDIQFEHLPTRCVPWSAEGEVPELSSAQVGVAPMLDDRWTRGKCALKVLQYMACGLPVLSSNCGANADIVVPGETGYLADAPEQWLEAVQQLSDPAHRRALGSAGRRRVEQHYSVQVLARKMDQLFTGILADR